MTSTSTSISTSLVHGTDENQINGIVFWLRRFQPAQINFLLDLERHWSKLDSEKMKGITAMLHAHFKTNHTVSDVRALLAYFNDNRSVALLHNIDIASLTHPNGSILTIEPFSVECSVCSSVLLNRHSSIRTVSVYWLAGAVTQGK